MDEIVAAVAAALCDGFSRHVTIIRSNSKAIRQCCWLINANNGSLVPNNRSIYYIGS